MDTATPPGKDDTLKQARFHARDGWLFLGLAHVALAAGLVVGRCAYTWAALADLGPERLTGLGVAVTACLVLAALGFWKLHLASRAGLTGRSMDWAWRLFVLYAVLSIMLLASELLPPGAGRNRFVASVPVGVLAAGLLGRLFTKEKPKLTPAREGLVLVAFGQLLIACLWAWPRLEPYAWCPAFQELERIWEWSLPGQRRPWVWDAPSTPMTAAMWSAPWTLLTVWGTCKVIFARQDGKRGWPARIGLCLLGFYAFVVALFLINLCIWEELCTRLAILVAVPAILLAIGVGCWLAGLRQANRPSWRRRAAFVIPLALLLLAFCVPFAGLTGLALTPSNPAQKSVEWPARLPRWAREPMAELVALVLPRTRRTFLQRDLASVRMARAAALKSSPLTQWPGWLCWRRLDPQGALATALAVPTTETPSIPVTAYDEYAGFIIGELGSDAEVLERLTGAYSDGLADSLCRTLHPSTRPGMAKIVAARFERLASPAANGMIGYLLVFQPDFSAKLLRGYAENPTPLDLARLRAAARLEWTFDKDHQLLRRMLQSENVEVRKIALSVYVPWEDLNPDWFRTILPSAEGRLPNSDADEQRLCADALNSLCEQMAYAMAGKVSVPGMPVGPLSPRERSDLQRLCALAREKLGLPPAQPAADDPPEDQEKAPPTAIE